MSMLAPFSFPAVTYGIFFPPCWLVLIKRGIVGRIDEVSIDLVNEWPLSLRLGLHLLPFRIRLKSSPIFLCLLTARMLQNVDKQVLRRGRILPRPITNAFHVMSFEDRVGVIAKPRFQFVHFALMNMIHAQFVNVM